MLNGANRAQMTSTGRFIRGPQRPPLQGLPQAMVDMVSLLSLLCARIYLFNRNLVFKVNSVESIELSKFSLKA